jgi:hypothetical protein
MSKIRRLITLRKVSLFLSFCYLVFKEQLLRVELSKLNKQYANISCYILRKEVIQPHLPIRLPCYDFTPIIYPTLGGWLLAVTPPTSGVANSRGVTGGVYKARERIHRGMLIRDY